jgi:hypothetical protein
MNSDKQQLVRHYPCDEGDRHEMIDLATQLIGTEVYVKGGMFDPAFDGKGWQEVAAASRPGVYQLVDAQFWHDGRDGWPPFFVKSIFNWRREGNDAVDLVKFERKHGFSSEV